MTRGMETTGESPIQMNSGQANNQQIPPGQYPQYPPSTQHQPQAYPPVSPQYPQPAPEQSRSERRAGEIDKRDTRGITGRWLVETAALVLLAFVIAMGVRALLVEPYRIPTGSMLPTIQEHDHILIYKLGMHLGATPEQFDVVVFYDPTDSFPNLVKRVIATEGQIVDLTPEGQVTIDGLILNEPYIVDGSLTFPLPPDINLHEPIQYPFSVPAGHVFVLGDNRQRSSDSRAFGPIATSEVKGIAFFTYWPLSNFATLE